MKTRLRNITITLEESVAHWARVEAATLYTSVSRFLGDILKERMKENEECDAAKRRALARKPFLKTEGRYLSREEVRDRARFRRCQCPHQCRRFGRLQKTASRSILARELVGGSQRLHQLSGAPGDLFKGQVKGIRIVRRSSCGGVRSAGTESDLSECGSVGSQLESTGPLPDRRLGFPRSGGREVRAVPLPSVP